MLPSGASESGWRQACRCRMDPGSRWRGLPREPSLKHLTDPSYGVPPEQQKPALQELTQAHVESFNYAVREGLGHAVQVSAAPQEPSQLHARWRRSGRRSKGALRGRRRTWGEEKGKERPRRRATGPREMAERSQYNPKWLCSVIMRGSARGLGSSRPGEDAFVIRGFIWDWEP